MYAKDKKKYQVENHNKSTVNRLKRIIPNPRIKFENTNVGEFDYRMLMRDKDMYIHDLQCEIIKLYEQLDLGKHYIVNINNENDNIASMYKIIRKQLLELNNDVYEVVDILVEYLYNRKVSDHKATLWGCFGDTLVENLKENIKQHLNDGWIMCEVCGKRIEATNNRVKYCDECWKSRKRLIRKEINKKYYQKNKDKQGD